MTITHAGEEGGEDVRVEKYYYCRKKEADLKQSGERR